jgi:hypothetical protein
MKKAELQEIVGKIMVEQFIENIGSKLTDGLATGLINVIQSKLEKALPDDPKPE